MPTIDSPDALGGWRGWVHWSGDFNLLASFEPLWSAIGAKAPKISMHLSRPLLRHELPTPADLLGDKSWNIFLGPLSVNIDALSQRVL